MRWATAAALALVLVQAVTIGALMRSPEQPYETASGPGSPSAAAGTMALVRFNDEATSAAISAALARHSATIVDGPRPGGLYRQIGRAHV